MEVIAGATRATARMVLAQQQQLAAATVRNSAPLVIRVTGSMARSARSTFVTAWMVVDLGARDAQATTATNVRNVLKTTTLLASHVRRATTFLASHVWRTWRRCHWWPP